MSGTGPIWPLSMEYRPVEDAASTAAPDPEPTWAGSASVWRIRSRAVGHVEDSDCGNAARRGRRRILQKLTSARDRAEVISWQSTLKQPVDVSDRDQHRYATVDQPHTSPGCRREPCAVRT